MADGQELIVDVHMCMNIRPVSASIPNLSLARQYVAHDSQSLHEKDTKHQRRLTAMQQIAVRFM